MFPTILDNESQCFKIQNCKFESEKYKERCARL